MNEIERLNAFNRIVSCLEKNDLQVAIYEANELLSGPLLNGETANVRHYSELIRVSVPNALDGFRRMRDEINGEINLNWLV